MYRLIFIIVLLLSGCFDNQASSAEYNHEIPVSKVLFVGEFESYSRIADLKQKISNENYEWSVVEDNKSSQVNRPPFHVYTIMISNYEHLEMKGRLRLQFFNDLLMEARFLPADKNRYFQALKIKNPDLQSSNEMSIAPALRVWISDGNPWESYAGWEDIRLKKEMRAWINKYG